jgi:hypothetical protein
MTTVTAAISACRSQHSLNGLIVVRRMLWTGLQALVCRNSASRVALPSRLT